MLIALHACSAGTPTKLTVTGYFHGSLARFDSTPTRTIEVTGLLTNFSPGGVLQQWAGREGHRPPLFFQSCSSFPKFY